MDTFFLDANVFIRLLSKDQNIALHKKAVQVFSDIESKSIRALTHTLVLHEVLYILIHIYDQPKKDVVDSIEQFLSLENTEVIDLEKALVIRALAHFKKHSIDFPDCIYAEFVKRDGSTLVSFDKDFKKLDIKRVEAIS